MQRPFFRIGALFALITLLVSSFGSHNVTASKPNAAPAPVYLPEASDSAPAPKASHRLIVELESPALAAWSSATLKARGTNGKLNLKSADARAYVAQLEAEQNAFIAQLSSALPGAAVGNFRNELGQRETLRFTTVFNGLVVDPGANDRDTARKVLQGMAGVKHVTLDYAHEPDLYASNELINSPALWNSQAIGGRGNAGAGVKVASMDGGVHKDAPMFSGAGYTFPPEIPAPGLGLTQNNNGKIIASRAYFRDWDLPSPGDENPWPGTQGTSHGVHTAGIAAGNVVTATYLGLEVPNMSGVAPRAWLMSYRVFYNSVTNNGSFYNAEGIAALEDIAADGADVVNNSWGGGPGSAGGEYDALDTALLNVNAAGTFVSMSAGNAGPANGTTDHPSDDYIVVAATSTDGTLASGRLNITAPQPISPTLQAIAFSPASFGAAITEGITISHPFLTAASVDMANVTGCNPWPAGTFNGKAAVISRGGCEFGVKVLNAENAGAEFAIVYNNQGEGLISMGPGVVGNQVTISSIFIPQSKGVGMVAWYAEHGAASTLELNTVAFQLGNVPDVVAGFSSRGPGVGDVLKPDIAAPGVNILSQGYTTGATGEARHLGYGQASGTSMASPHVAGAAALLRQVHPNWTNAQIKSAMMSTSKFQDIFNGDNSPAQPLDIGAGRLDLTRAADPGVFLSPPSLSFGQVVTGTTKTITVTVHSASNTSETYDIGTIFTGDGFPGTPGVAGLSVSPSSITVPAGGSATFTATFNATNGRGYGDNQGYVTLDGPTHDAHLAAWARVTYATGAADVLVIDNDASSLGIGQVDVANYYTETLELAGISYEVLDVDNLAGLQLNFIPEAVNLYRYKAVVYFTGNNYQPNGTFTVPTPLTTQDQDRLTEYANNGGLVIAMGQDLSAALNSTTSASASFFYGAVLGGKYLADSVTEGTTPTVAITATAWAPPALQNATIDIGLTGDGMDNQFFVDELDPRPNYNPNDPELELPYVPLLAYEDKVVAMAHREQPTLERPGVTYTGRSIYTSFGLEGVNNNQNTTSRVALLKSFLDWGWDNPTASIASAGNGANKTLTATLTSPITGSVGVRYRWDFGDGTAYTTPSASNQVNHVYTGSGTYTVRVEATDSYGNSVVASTTVTTPNRVHWPLVLR